MKRCSGCQIAWYCSEAHQKAAWSEHKKQCKKIQKERQHAAIDAGSILAQLAAVAPSRENAITPYNAVGDENNQKILGSNADIDSINIEGCSPAYISAQQGHLNCLKLLAEHGADLNKKSDDGWAPIHTACQSGKFDCAAFLLETVDANTVTSEEGRTPAILACAFGHDQVLQLLIDHNATLNQGDNKGQTPAYVSAQEGHLNCLKLLAQV
jgi:ankyrin repeat protein